MTLLGDGDGLETGVELLCTPVDALSFEETVARAGEPMTQRGVMVQVSLNVAKLVKIRSDAMPREDVNSSGIISADGTRILLAGRLFGVPIPARVAGIDLMSGALALCARDGLRPYFLGAPAVFSARSSPKYTRRAI